MKGFILSSIFVSITILASIPFHDLYAQSSSNTKVTFTISPPPVSYPEMHKGEILHKLGGSVLSINTDVMDLVGALPSYSMQVSPSDVVGINVQTGLGIITGNKYDMFLIQMPFRMSVQYQVAKIDRTTFFTFGGVGMDLAISTMKIKSPGTKIDILASTFMFPFQGGFQVNYERWDFIISPYVTANVTTGFAMTTSTVSSTLYSTSTSSDKSISPFTNIVFGFDALYKPWGVSLSTFIQNSKDTKLVMLSLGKIIARKMLPERAKKS